VDKTRGTHGKDQTKAEEVDKTRDTQGKKKHEHFVRQALTDFFDQKYLLLFLLFIMSVLEHTHHSADWGAR